jgi:hypothetical protein
MTAQALLALMLIEGFCAGLAQRFCHQGHTGHVAADRYDATPAPVADGQHLPPGPPSPRPLGSKHDESQCLACRMGAKQAVLANLFIAPQMVEVTEFVERPQPTNCVASQITLPLSRAPPAAL